MKKTTLFIFLLSFLSISYLACAQSADQVSDKRKMQLSAAKERLVVAKQIQQLESAKLKIDEKQKQVSEENLPVSEIKAKLVQDAQVELATAQANVDSAKIAVEESSQMINNIKLRISELGDRIREVTLAPGESRQDVKASLEKLNAKMTFEQTLLQTEQQRHKDYQRRYH